MTPGASITDDELRTLYDLAGHLARVRPGREEQHWSDYKAFAREADVVRFVAGGAPRGFFMRRGGRDRLNDRTYRWTQDEYYFIEPGWRHHAAPELARLRQFTRIACLPGPPCYFVADVYPASYLLLRDVFGPLITAAGPVQSPWDRSLLLALGERIAGDNFDATEGIVHTDTVPPPPPERFATPVHARRFQEYENVNPRWRDSRTALVAAQITPASVSRLIRMGAARAIPRSRRHRT